MYLSDGAAALAVAGPEGLGAPKRERRGAREKNRSAQLAQTKTRLTSSSDHPVVVPASTLSVTASPWKHVCILPLRKDLRQQRVRCAEITTM